MSTLFAVKIDGKMVEVAHRRSGKMVWLTPIAKKLPNNRRVYALDNGQQGIMTIADVKYAIETGKICL